MIQGELRSLGVGTRRARLERSESLSLGAK
jgi:hypothetical protein